MPPPPPPHWWQFSPAAYRRAALHWWWLLFWAYILYIFIMRQIYFLYRVRDIIFYLCRYLSLEMEGALEYSQKKAYWEFFFCFSWARRSSSFTYITRHAFDIDRGHRDMSFSRQRHCQYDFSHMIKFYFPLYSIIIFIESFAYLSPTLLSFSPRWRAFGFSVICRHLRLYAFISFSLAYHFHYLIYYHYYHYIFITP